ncbi:flagellar hook-basal body complex protein [Natronospirillum operosum]|uniref:Flagellar hook protein FlgE n=1 Tax=Natronospirillum operosum TaxID=2759953 RepID=A0A4Z0WJM0_9GAMM|nr:flagellar hook-basal body complex protein [Natronospirillum operosum]TGG95997.1 flagellar hook-basal body complex protein [Natronospirillum operosum]
MAFGTGLSGVSAANQDLKVTGNNIANASTTGFKLSRAEFGDAYTQSILGMGRSPIGGGVRVAEIGQKFTQGNISQTGNALDMAIDGTGFFIMDYPGVKTTYTRSGIFGINDQGYIVNNQDARLQGFGITNRGTADGILGDIRIDQAAQPPRATQKVDAGVNVPAGAPVLQQLGSITRTNGLAIGQVQTGAPEATASKLSTIGPPLTEGTAAQMLGSVNVADRYTGTDELPLSYVYSTGPTPEINAILANNAADLTADNTDDSIIIEVERPDGTTESVAVGPLSNYSTDPDDLAADLQTAINGTSLQGNVLVRNVGGNLELYSTDGTIINEVAEDTGTLGFNLGLLDGAGDPDYAPDTRLLLNDADAGADIVQVTVRDTDDDSDETFDIDFTGAGNQNFATRQELIDYLQDELDAQGGALFGGDYAAGDLIVQEDPFGGGGIEIVSADAADNRFRILNIQDSAGTIGSQLNITNGSQNERIFQAIPNPTDTIQIQVQDPNINNGTPTTVQLQPFASGANFTSLDSLIDAFQSALDANSILGGRVQIQEDPDQEGVLQLLSTTGTRITSINDQGGSQIADTLNLVGGTISPSIFSQLPPSSPGTVDISLQGPNINNGDPVTETIEPFPSDRTINNMTQLIDSFQTAIRNNPSLAGRVRLEEAPDNPGRLRLIADGPFGSDGTAILGMTDNVGSVASLLGMDVNDPAPDAPTVTSPVAGTRLFADGGSIDLTSIEGTPVRVIGNDATELDFNNFIPGNPTRLTGSLNLTTPIGDGSGTLQMSIQSGNTVDTISVNVPTGGFTSAAGLVSAINSQINASAQLNGQVSAGLDSSNRLRFTNANNGPDPIIVNDNGSSDAITADNLGLTTNSNPQPTQVLGVQDEPANNEIDIAVGGDNPGSGTVLIPAGDYDSPEAVVEALNNQIQGNASLFGRVEAYLVNDRIGFRLTEVGGFPNTLEVSGNSASMEAIGHESQSEPEAIDPVDRRTSFRINLTVPEPDDDNRSGSVRIELDENIRSIEQLAQAINRELADVPEEDFIGVRARVQVNDDGTKQLQFVATQDGEPSQISLSDVRAPGEDITLAEINALLQIDRFNNEYLELGQPKVTNGYPEQTFILQDADGEERTITLDANLSAAQIANRLTDQPGVRASATTELKFLADDYVNAGNMNIFINDQVIEANTFQNMVSEINQYQQSTLRGITASVNDAGDLVLRSASGADITVEVESPRTADRLTLLGETNTSPITLGGTEDAENTARVGGTVEIILNEGVTMRQPDPRVTGLFNGLTSDDFEDYVINRFDPQDSETYNERGSITVYDSLGTSHQLDLFFVKDPDDPDRPQDLNSWTVYAQIDGRDIGEPDPDLPFPENQEPTQASFTMFFSPDGTLDEDASGDWLISNWIPRNEEGNPTGAYPPQTSAEGGRLPLGDPNVTSNFEINFRDTTQYGGSFARNDFQQDGYASGRLRDISVDDEGFIFARYTNGENQKLGQVALANFRNPEGLDPSGFTEWTETADSGSVTISSAGTGVLGNIKSSSLEDSNVDLSEQLVNLIIAQRNYQASAKTIETTNAVTQTIINLR